jgi:hypothetical protein
MRDSVAVEASFGFGTFIDFCDGDADTDDAVDVDGVDVDLGLDDADIGLHLGKPPAASEVVRVVCSSSAPHRVAVVPPAPMLFDATTWSTSRRVSFCRLADGENGLAGVTTVTLSCSVQSVAAGVPASAFSSQTTVVWSTFVALRGVVWPHFADVVVDGTSAASASGSTSFSVTTAGGVNATLVADTGARLRSGPAFAEDGVAVIVGGIEAQVWGVDHLGALLFEVRPAMSCGILCVVAFRVVVVGFVIVAVRVSCTSWL